MSTAKTVSETDLPGLLLIHRGKVRDVYRADEERLLLVATDRISAFDCVMPTPIPFKGRVLTQISAFWFQKLVGVARNHLITANFNEMPEEIRRHDNLEGRSMLVKETDVFPVECVVRGYLEGSGWKEYRANGQICGHLLPPGLTQCDRLPEPIFTPATKEKSGHDINITEEEFYSIVGRETGEKLKTKALDLYREASEYALTRGIIIADTKFEFGRDRNDEILLIDEVLTPDSSRFWSVADHQPGQAQPSLDKQFVREYLETLDWDKTPPAPALPPEIIRATTRRYLEAYQKLTGRELNDRS